MGRTNIKCQNGPVPPPAQFFYFNGQALQKFINSSKDVLNVSPLKTKAVLYMYVKATYKNLLNKDLQ
jgi:hypothetical protein